MAQKTYTLITGASDGLGAEFARQYAQKGRNLILVARSKDKLDKLKAELSKEHGIDVQIVTADLAKPGAAEDVFAKCKPFTVSTLVNNAGQAIGGAWDGHSLDRIRFLLNLNTGVVIELTSLFLPQLKAFAKEHGRKKTKEGGLLNVSSTSAFQAIPWMAAYSASKAYLLHLTEGIHDEMKERCPELRVSCLCPGPTTSTIWDKNGASAKDVAFPMTTVPHVVRDGIRGLERGQAIVIPGWLNYLGSYGPQLGPRWLSRLVASRGMGQSHLAESELTEEQKKSYGLLS